MPQENPATPYHAFEMAGRFGQYLWSALVARPRGMFVAPNLVALGAIGLLGLLNPGVWIIGAGLELAYLFALVSNPRFRKWVDARLLSTERADWDHKVKGLLRSLDAPLQQRYRSLEERCRGMVAEPALAGHTETRKALSEALGRLLWVYLQLLVTRQAAARVLLESQRTARERGETLLDRQADLKRRLAEDALDDDLRRSLEGQLELVNQRLEGQREARDKLDFIDAELARVEEQVHLVREQAMLAADHDAASHRIDAIQSALGSTTQWIRDQQRLSGELAEALEGSPPPVMDVD